MDLLIEKFKLYFPSIFFARKQYIIDAENVVIAKKNYKTDSILKVFDHLLKEENIVFEQVNAKLKIDKNKDDFYLKKLNCRGDKIDLFGYGWRQDDTINFNFALLLTYDKFNKLFMGLIDLFKIQNDKSGIIKIHIRIYGRKTNPHIFLKSRYFEFKFY